MRENRPPVEGLLAQHKGKGDKGGKDPGKGTGKALSQGYGGYGKDTGAKGAGKGGGKKGWSPNGFRGTCYNCGEVGHSAKWCPKGKGGGGGKMSWMGSWEQDWSGSGNGEEATAAPVPMLTSWLRPVKPIK